MQREFLIKNGTVIDGTGAAPIPADVRVRDGVITEIAPGLAREGRERVIDAAGCYVTPGFIECHNHMEGPMWWSPTMDPMPGYGVTTSISGNCGFAAAPMHPDPAVRKEMIDLFSFIEDIPEKPFVELLPWDWQTWSEYKASIERNVKMPVNFGAYVGHIAIRLAVMGSAAWERVATPDEVKRMCAHLEDALSAGAMGLSTNLLDHDKKARAVPSLLADDAEFTALLEVLARYPGRSLQVIIDVFMRMTGLEATARMSRLVGHRKVRVQVFGGIPTLDFQKEIAAQAEAAHAKRKSEGQDFWMGYHHIPPVSVVAFTSTLAFAVSNNYVWNEVIEAKTEEEKIALLSDAAWRVRARESWEKTHPNLPMRNPALIELFESEYGEGPTGVRLSQFQKERGLAHPSDALADWVLENGIGSTLRLGDWNQEEDTLIRLFRDDKAMGNFTDAGAHGKMLCGIGDNMLLFTTYVRSRNVLKVEEAVHILTGQPAELFGLHDRGVLKVGMKADIAVFNLDEIECRADKKIYDVPDGEGGRTYRYTRDPAPMRLTMVNGIPTFERNAFTGHFPGRCIGPTPAPLAHAAE